MNQPALFESEPLPPAPADEAEDVVVRLSVGLTLEEVEAVAAGQLPDSLVTYCREGLVALTGTLAESMAAANTRLREARQRRTA